MIEEIRGYFSLHLFWPQWRWYFKDETLNKGQATMNDCCGMHQSMGTSKKRQTDSFELKKGSCPVNGMNSYSVFKNGVLVFMMDGDRASVFRPEEVGVIDIGGDMRLYRVSNWVFTGCGGLSVVLNRFLPKGCVICSAIDKVVE